MKQGQREDLLELRKTQQRPWHSPPHFQGDKKRFMVTAACYEHKSVLGASPTRIAAFESELISLFENNSLELYAWVVLPNHYHGLFENR